MDKIPISCGRSNLRVIGGLIILALMLSSSQISSSTGQAGPVANINHNGNYNSYPDYALSSLNTNNIVSLGLLNSLTGGNSSVFAYEHVIQQTLLTVNVRQILLDISWQNYSIGAIPYEQWVDNWLTACDVLGVNNVFYVGQFTNAGIGSPWIQSLIRADPSAQTYNQTGKPVSFVSFDNPDVATATEKDLMILESYYGDHPSWMGIGTGYPQNDPYYSNSSMPIMGYSNFTLQNFANSAYFQRDVNASGYLPNGQQDSLWAEFRSAPQSTVLSSGNWMTSTAYEVYGVNSNQHSMLIRFYVPDRELSLLIQWYGNKVGNPAPLRLSIVNDHRGDPAMNQVIANATTSSNLVSLTTGWQTGFTVNGNFSSGYYWAVLSSPGSDSNDYYDLYMRDYSIQDSKAIYMLPTGSGQIEGSSILWLKAQNGSDLVVYPYEGSYIPNSAQQFTAESTFSFNTVYLFLSDRIYNPTNGTLNIVDSTQNRLVASGILSQQLTHGQQNWIPINLNRTVTTIPGDLYVMSISEPNSGYSWQTVLRGIMVNPAKAGFQNQSQSWLFKLGMVNFTQGYWDFTALTTTGVDSVTLGHPDAIQFTVPPSTSGTQILTNVSVIMRGGGGSNYQSNTSLAISIYSNDPVEDHPIGSPLTSKTVEGNLIPRSGLLSVSGYNLSLSSGQSYWAVFSTDSTGVAFSFARLVSPYNLNFLVSSNGGKSWTNPAEGPTELSFVADFSSGSTVGNFIDNIPTITITPSVAFAEPFIARNNTQAVGVFLGPLGGSSSPNDFEVVSINPDNGKGLPSADELASGNIYSENITLNYGLQFVQLSSAARLEAGQKYWIVIHPMYGAFSLDPIEYLKAPSAIPANLTAMISKNGGYSWNRVGNDTTVLSYVIAGSPIQLPEYSTAKLYSDLTDYHDFSTSSGVLRGWNAYIQSSELQMFSGIAAWFQSTTGKSFDFFANAEPNVIHQLGYSNIVPVSLKVSNSTCTALAQDLMANMNQEIQQFNEIGNISLLQQCPNSLAMALAMNYMKYLGTGYGTSSGGQVLVVGDKQSNNLSKYLSNAYRTSYVSLENESALVSLGNLSDFNAIVWLSTNASSALESAMFSYLSNGGTLIVATQPPPWMSNFTGIDWSSVNTIAAVEQPLNQSLRELSQSVYHTRYYSTLQEYRISNTTIVGQSQGLTVGISAFRSGKVDFVYLQNGSEEIAQMSDSLIVLSNMISSSFGQNQSSPFWYENNNPAATNGVFYSIIGNGQSPLLVWLFNPTSKSVQVSLHLNGTQYCIGSSWILLNPSGVQIVKGNGSDIGISTTVPSYGWTAIYVMDQAITLNIAYSSEAVTRQLAYNGQALFSLVGSVNQSSIAIVSSNGSAESVILDGNRNVTRVSAIGNLLNATQGWLYDAQNHLILIKYVSSGNDTIRVILPNEPAPISTPILSYVPTIELLLLGVAAAEVGIWSAFKFKKRQ